MISEQIINKEAYELGLELSSMDRKMIRERLNVVPSAVDNVLSGNRKAIRGKSLQILEMARKLAEINRQKAELLNA